MNTKTILVTGAAGFIGFQPKTPLKTGLNTFYQWYKSYYI
jgi:nucleoside-diphosphate-sugar epimerase